MGADADLKIDSAEFWAGIDVQGKNVQVALTGTADLNVKTELDRFLEALHHQTVGQGATEVTVDMRRLEFVNSSCLKSFVTWIHRVQALPADQAYRIVFLSNPQLHWQRRSLHALSCFAQDLITVVS